MFGSPRKALLNQLEVARHRIAELEAWKAQKEAQAEKALVLQIELAGEIVNTVRRTASISQKSAGMGDRMGLFEGEFRGASTDLAGIDGQITELSASISTTGSAIYQTSAAVEQMSASISKIAEESTTRFHDIKNLADLSKSGQMEMESTLHVIQEVTAGIDDLRNFLEIIDDIAGKTSILSMNAAIQAAHAGDVGKGFAVVADEIRRLAESSATNAAGITKKLNGLIEAIHKAEESSLKTSRILTESEEKVSKATAGFQEIEQGARELALGGQEMLQGVSSLRQASSAMTETSFVIAQNSAAVTSKVQYLQAESKKLEEALAAIRIDTSDLNGAGMSLSQTTVNQLSAGREGESTLDPTFSAILILQHLTWITRVRGVLDGKFQVDLSTLGDHHQCELGVWLQTKGRQVVPGAEYQRLSENHEKMHTIAKTIIGLRQTVGREKEAEEAFPQLVALSDSLVQTIQSLSESVGGHDVLIRWSAAFELGHRTIDGQHRRLVDLTNRMYAAVRGGQTRAILGEVLDELVAYTVTHFRDEEALFQASTYPEKVKHLEQHRDFVATASRLQSDFHTGKVVLGSETVEFLKDWLVNHIQGSDRGYAKFL